MADSQECRIQLDTIARGFDGRTCWIHPRAGIVPGAGRDGGPAVVLTLQKGDMAGSDIFYGLHTMRSDDLGATWTGPEPEPHLSRWTEPGGIEAGVCDFQPAWHAASGVLLGTGHTVRYVGNRLMPEPRPKEAAYAVYDPDARRWSPPQFLDMPDPDRFFSAGAGAAQRVDLPDGTALLPIYFKARSSDANSCLSATVVRCAFDGRRLTYVQHGDVLTVPEPRGLYEPSLARFGGRFYLTLRNDARGHVAIGDDGLHFDAPRPWTFDDGSDLGNYNTQQHWVVGPGCLWLVYTRRGLDNDHVFRHRAPLVMARVDTERLCVIRETERVLVPERGARLGNFGVTRISERESWVTVAEWMQPAGCERHGSDGSVFVARLLWA